MKFTTTYFTRKSLNHLILLISFLVTSFSYGQVSISNATTAICNSPYYDSGGTGDYNTNNYTQIINPGVSSGKVQAAFTGPMAFNNHGATNTTLSVYNGQGTGGTLLGTYTNGQTPGPLTSTDATGALTFVFDRGTSTGTAAGWAANITNTGFTVPTIAYSGGPFCQTGTKTVTRTGVAGGTYSALPAGLSINSATGLINLAASSAGTYTVSYNYGTGVGCVAATASVTVKQGPTGVSAGPDVSVCTGGSVVLNGSVNSIPGFSYSENFNGCNSANCNGWTISGGSQPGINTWISCSNSAANDNIKSASPDSYVRTNNSLFTSNGNLVTFSFSYQTENHSSFASIPATYCTFKVEWSPDGTNWTTLSTFNNQDNTNCNNHTTTFTPPPGQNVYLRVHAHRNNGDFDFLIDDISVSQSASTPPVSWSGTSIVGGTTLTPTVNPTTTTVYTMTATVNGCSVSDNVTVTINNLPAVPIPSASNPNFCAPNTTNLVAKGMAPSDKAISFGTGSFSYVEVPNVPAYNFSGNNTIEAWVNPSATIGEGIIFNKENQYEAKVHSDGTLQWAYWTTSSWNWVNTGYVIPLNTWTHVAFVHNTTGTISTYVNGNLISGLPVATGSIQTTTSTFRIGNRGSNSPFYGKIDNVRLWSTARTQAQILADMYLETPTVTTNLIANYPLNGNGNALVGTNGTLTNAGGAAWVDANYYTYTWSNGPQLPTPSTNETQTTGSLTNANVGTHNYRVTATTAGCPGTLSSNVTVKVDQNPILPTSLAADYNNALYNCHGRQVELTATGGTLYGTSNYIYGTSSGGTQVSTATTNTTVTHIPTATTTNYYVGTTANGACAAQNSGILLTYNLPTAGTTLSGNNESATCYVNGNNYIHFYHSSGRLIATINPNGQDLGNVTATSYIDAGLSVPACDDPTNPNYNTATMGRHWVITPTTQPAVPVLVRLPFGSLEYTTAQTASTSNSNPNDNLTGLASLKLSKYSGTNEDHLFSNNCGNGTTTLWTQSSSGLVNSYISPFNVTDQFASFSIPSFSEFWLHGQTSSPLPVTLTNFSASCDKQVILNWSTASEQNSDRFIVEKSRDGQTWSWVATQTAAGNSNTTLHYTQTDENSWNGLTYYRLRQVDYNGEEEIYGPISVSCEGNESSMTVYPNPNSGSFTIEIASTEMYNNAQLFLTDLTGKVITSQTVNVANGTTQILINDLDLKMGTYLVTLRGADQQLKPVKVMVTK